MRHIIGFFLCLAFITLILTFSAPFVGWVRNSDTHVTSVVDTLAFDPDLGPMTRYTVQVFGMSFSPALAIGHVAAIVVSPIGLLAVMLYYLLARVLPKG